MRNLFLLFVAVISFTLHSQQEGIKFHKEISFEDALKIAKEENKLIFMDCFTTWCGPCIFLANEIFPNKDLGEFYNEYFINVSFDMEKGEGIAIRKKYNVNAFPTLLFLDYKGEIVHKGIGAGDVLSMTKMGEVALNDTKNYRAVLGRIESGEITAEILSTYLGLTPGAQDKDELLEKYFKSVSEEEYYTEDAWLLFKHFISNLTHSQFNYFLENRKRFEETFGKAEVDYKILSAFQLYLKQNGNDKATISFLQSIDNDIYTQSLVCIAFNDAYIECATKELSKLNWSVFMNAAEKYLAFDWITPLQLNTYSWFVYEKYKEVGDLESLEIAEKWAQTAYNSMPDNHYILDTYAHILFDLGHVQEAIKYEEQALNLTGHTDNEQSKFYSEELEKFKMNEQ